jgi:ParB/RepB/Spo0J family partition protein
MTDNTVIEGTAQSSELIWIDPNHLAAHPANIRTDLGLKDLAELSASIAARGVIEPLIVAPEDAGYRILAGHRRCAAAITVQLATVPCWIRGDLTDNADQVITMLVENTRRRDLSIAEEANGYAQLALAGSPPGRSPRRPVPNRPASSAR